MPAKVSAVVACRSIRGASKAASWHVRSSTGAPVALAADCPDGVLALDDAKADEHEPAQRFVQPSSLQSNTQHEDSWRWANNC